MAIGACNQQALLAVFADNSAQNITAADMRLLINCVYDNFLDVVNIIDNVDTYIVDKALSANQGAILNDKIETNSQNIQDLETEKADAIDVYTKIESDTNYYNRTYTDANFYKKPELYTRQEIDNALFTIQQSLESLSARIDNIVSKNNLIE
jgi:hypothetical protein